MQLLFVAAFESAPDAIQLNRNRMRFVYMTADRIFRYDEHQMQCKRCGEDDDELELMVATIHGEPRYLCQKCGEMN
jgi:predicted SprT family Zn-dependent metalloprotease